MSQQWERVNGVTIKIIILGIENKNAKHNQIMLARQTRKTNENKPKNNTTERKSQCRNISRVKDNKQQQQSKHKVQSIYVFHIHIFIYLI